MNKNSGGSIFVEILMIKGINPNFDFRVHIKNLWKLESNKKIDH